MKHLNNHEVMFLTNNTYTGELKELQNFNFLISGLSEIVNIPNFLSLVYKKMNFKYKGTKKYSIEDITYNESDEYSSMDGVIGKFEDGIANYIVRIEGLNKIPVIVDSSTSYKEYRFEPNTKGARTYIIVNKNNLLFAKQMLDVMYSKR